MMFEDKVYDNEVCIDFSLGSPTVPPSMTVWFAEENVDEVYLNDVYGKLLSEEEVESLCNSLSKVSSYEEACDASEKWIKATTPLKQEAQ